MTGANGADMVGQVLGGRYRVTATIGRGGMGVVARAVDQLLNREVAVKVLRAYTDASPAELADLRVRMQREAQAAARIRHSGVVTVHDVVEEQGLPVIVMELVDGPSLDDLLTERGPMDPREAAAIGAKLMDALDAAHRAGVLHRDVKPGNVLLESSGRVVLTDFGIASMDTSGEEALAKLTQSGQIVGSLDYLPPERAQGQVPGAASDIWALGMTLYAAVEGAAPFRRTSVWSTLAAIVGEPLPAPRLAGPLAPVLQALMAKDPLQRPDAAQAREMLEAVAAGRTPGAAPTPGTGTGLGTAQAPGPGGTPTAGLGVHPAAPAAGLGATPNPGTAPGLGAAPNPGMASGTGTNPGTAPGLGATPPPAPAPQAVTPPPAAFGPPAATPFSQPAPQPAAFSLPADAYGAPAPHPGAAHPGVAPGVAAGGVGRAETRATAVRARRRRTRTVVAVAAATVLTCGGVAYALIGMRGDADTGGSDTALPTASTSTDGDMSDAGGATDGATSPGDLTSISPSATPSATPSQKDGDSGATSAPGDGDGDADDKPTASPSASKDTLPSSTVKEPTPVSTACTGWAHSNRSSGVGAAGQNTHLYTGPYAECSYVTVIKTGVKVSYDCYVTNAHGNKWIFARIQGTTTEGWIFADKSTLTGGSLIRC
ncbi:serine/threonine-protein kinase [Streptomyces sp. NPDC127114]|uniref:serine/threonine-protein kinase n=1 Tax=Streptomyces sp. NPDC127114 TaxID=3345366 RepID=UPI003635A803